MIKAFTLLIITFIGLSCSQEQWFVGGIHFSGNQTISRDELLTVMQSKPPEFFSRYPFSFSILVDDIAAIQRLYARHGFFSAGIRPGDLFRDSSDSEVWINIEIDEGVRAVIDSILLENSSVIPDSLLLNFLPIKVNEPFDSLLYEQSDNDIRDTLASKGYLFAEVQKVIRFNLQGDSAVITYEIDQGPVVKPGEIEIIGADKLNDFVIRRELSFYGKTVVTSDDLSRSASNLYRTELFDFVTIDPLDTSIDIFSLDTLSAPVTVQVQMADMFTIQSGGGYSTNDGLYGSVELSYKNLFSAAHRITGSAHLSNILRGAQIIYLYPWFLNSPLSAEFRTYIERKVEIEYSGLFRGISVSLSGELNQQNSYRTWLRIENTGWIQTPSPTNDLNDNILRNFVLIGIGFTHDSRSTISEPGFGFYFNIEPELAGPGIYWSDKYFKVKGEVKANYSLINKHVSFHSSLTSGYITSYGIARQVPTQELFIPGDEWFSSVRGYNDADVVTIDDEDNPQGGRFAIVITPFEMVFPVYKLLKGVIFTDGGFFWPTLQSVTLHDIKWSVGAGIRVNSPAGIVRLDYGIPLDRDLEFKGRIHFGLGAEF